MYSLGLQVPGGQLRLRILPSYFITLGHSNFPQLFLAGFMGNVYSNRFKQNWELQGGVFIYIVPLRLILLPTLALIALILAQHAVSIGGRLQWECKLSWLVVTNHFMQLQFVKSGKLICLMVQFCLSKLAFLYFSKFKARRLTLVATDNALHCILQYYQNNMSVESVIKIDISLDTHKKENRRWAFIF